MDEIKTLIDENPQDGLRPEESQVLSTKGEYPVLEGLSEKEQKTTAAWKWAISENARLQQYEDKYHTLDDKYHNLHEEYEVYKAKNSKNPLLDTISCILFVLGPLALGWITSINDSSIKTLIAIIGGCLLIGAIIIKIAQYIRS